GIEPYPTAIYPKFRNVVVSRQKITIIKPNFVVFYADGHSQKVDYYRLFNNVPISHINYLVVNSLNPERRINPGRWQDKPFKSFKLGRYTIEWRRTPDMHTSEEIYERNTFLRKRIIETTGHQSPIKLQIKWYQYDFVFGEGLVQESRRPVYDATFDLTELKDA
ncbi:MAG: hypothetical protein O7C75_19335, partial [Verrucomicrobia bacterium]|nr:hypothetical protein [Verrucomicrobiota bacterium]